MARTWAGMSGDDRARMRRRSIGYMYQDFNLLAGLTALENVALPLELDGVGGRRARAIAMAALDQLGAVERAPPAIPTTYRGANASGWQSPRAVVRGHHLLLADKPTGPWTGPMVRALGCCGRPARRVWPGLS